MEARSEVTSVTDDRSGLVRLVLALKPYLPELVIIGGWAHRLYELHPSAKSVEFDPLLTSDVDIALRKKLAPKEEDLRTLLHAAGFEEEFVGVSQPPVTHYRLGGHERFYAEFLAPRVGASTTATSKVVGVNVQHLRHLEVLMVEPWWIKLARPKYELEAPVELRIANPTSYLAQKILILDRRERADRARDILYLHDTLLLFGSSLGELKDLWTRAVAPSVHKNAARTLQGSPESVFGAVTDDIREASQIAAGIGRSIKPEDVASVCHRGLTAVFS